MGLKVTKSDLAAIFGVPQSKVEGWIQLGLPHSSQKGKNAEPLYDTAEVIAWCLKQQIKL